MSLILPSVVRWWSVSESMAGVSFHVVFGCHCQAAVSGPATSFLPRENMLSSRWWSSALSPTCATHHHQQQPVKIFKFTLVPSSHSRGAWWRWWRSWRRREWKWSLWWSEWSWGARSSCHSYIIHVSILLLLHDFIIQMTLLVVVKTITILCICNSCLC